MSDTLLVIKKVKDTLIRAASVYSEDHKEAIIRALNIETVPQAKWVLENLMENACIAEKFKSPLCDDTGVPHLFVEIGKKRILSGAIIEAIHEGVQEGLRELPGRPMSVKGNEIERLEQTSGLDIDPGSLEPAPMLVKTIDQNIIKLYILMQGGGPEIRGRTFKVFHQHDISVIIEEIVKWATEEVVKLGCTPCSAAIGIGRSHFEAASLMIESMAKANFNIQNEIEKEITKRINESQVGPLGLGGNSTTLATFLNVGAQRASGVRIVCIRLCCCVEPRVASVLI